MREDYRRERIYIAFRPKDQKFEVADAAIRRDPKHIVYVIINGAGSMLVIFSREFGLTSEDNSTCMSNN